MPNIIKKVLANVAQVLTDVEKQQARDNIGIPKYGFIIDGVNFG